MLEAIPATLPSQPYGFWLVEKAMEREATIVVMRGVCGHGRPQFQASTAIAVEWRSETPAVRRSALRISDAQGSTGSFGFQRRRRTRELGVLCLDAGEPAAIPRDRAPRVRQNARHGF